MSKGSRGNSSETPESRQLEIPRLTLDTPAVLQSPNATALRLMDAALDLFADGGYESTSMEDIADTVKITKGSLYHYVSGKSDLLAAVLVTSYRAHSMVANQLNANPQVGLAAVLQYMTAHLSIHLPDTRPARILERDWRSLTNTHRDLWITLTQRQLDYLRTAVRDGQRAGDIATGVHPGLTATAIFGMLAWIHSWYQPGTSLKPEMLSQTYTELIADGLRTRSGIPVFGDAGEDG